MSRQVIEKLSSAGSYAIGQKAAHQEFLSIPHFEKLRKAFLAWSGRYLRGRYTSEYGPAARAEIEMSGHRNYFTKFVRPGIRTNPLKLYPTLTADKSGDIEQEMVDYQQTIGTGPQIGTTISVM